MTMAECIPPAEGKLNSDRTELQALREEIFLSLMALDGRIGELESWGTVLMHLCASNDHLDHDAVGVVGGAVKSTSRNLHEHWRDIVDQVRPEARA